MRRALHEGLTARPWRVRLRGWRKWLGSIVCNCGPGSVAEKGMTRDAFFRSGDLGQRLVILPKQNLGP